MLTLSVFTPTRCVLESVSVQDVRVPGMEGEIGILAGHAPLLSALKEGLVKYRLFESPEKEQIISVHWGYLEVYNDHISVLTEESEEG